MNKTQIDKKPSFVDLGCGNGLLVYILNKEGYPGSGIDVRKRKIWNHYPSEVKLEVKTINLFFFLCRFTCSVLMCISIYLKTSLIKFVHVLYLLITVLTIILC